MSDTDRREHLAGDAGGRGAQYEALAVVVEFDLLQAVELTQHLGPFRLAPGVGQARLEFLAQHQRLCRSATNEKSRKDDAN